MMEDLSINGIKTWHDGIAKSIHLSLTYYRRNCTVYGIAED
jgi:hypothetical protein